jgi:hypothetical protein
MLGLNLPNSKIELSVCGNNGELRQEVKPFGNN